MGFWDDNIGYSHVNTNKRTEHFHSPEHPEIVDRAEEIMKEDDIDVKRIDENTLESDVKYGRKTIYQAAAQASREQGHKVNTSVQATGTNVYQVTLKIVGKILGCVAIAAIALLVYKYC